MIEIIPVFRYINYMTFKELLKEKNTSGYQLSKNTDIPYSTISDLMNGKTNILNVSFKHAIKIAHYLNINIEQLCKLETVNPDEFRYFRNNLLHKLKHSDQKEFIEEIIKTRSIDYYYKNNHKEYAFYLLALIDYLCRINGLPIYTNRYNRLRTEKLDKPFYVGGSIIIFDSLATAEDKLNIKIIPEFKRFNIIEGGVFDVA